MIRIRRTIRIKEAAEKCSIKVEVLTEWIEKEWIVLAEPESQELDDEDLARIRLIKNLKEDFGVNAEGIPIILHLIDQIHHIHQRLKS